MQEIYIREGVKSAEKTFGHGYVDNIDFSSTTGIFEEKVKEKLELQASNAAVITECRLTDMDGFEFLAALRSHAPSTPVIVLTAHGTIEGYLQCLDLGVVEYVNKPLRPRELERIVTAALGRPWSERRDAA